MQQDTFNYLINGLIFVGLGGVMIIFALILSAITYDLVISVYRSNRIK